MSHDPKTDSNGIPDCCEQHLFGFRAGMAAATNVTHQLTRSLEAAGGECTELARGTARLAAAFQTLAEHSTSADDWPKVAREAMATIKRLK